MSHHRRRQAFMTAVHNIEQTHHVEEQERELTIREKRRFQRERRENRRAAKQSYRQSRQNSPQTIQSDTRASTFLIPSYQELNQIKTSYAHHTPEPPATRLPITFSLDNVDGIIKANEWLRSSSSIIGEEESSSHRLALDDEEHESDPECDDDYSLKDNAHSFSSASSSITLAAAISSKRTVASRADSTRTIGSYKMQDPDLKRKWTAEQSIALCRACYAFQQDNPQEKFGKKFTKWAEVHALLAENVRSQRSAEQCKKRFKGLQSNWKIGRSIDESIVKVITELQLIEGTYEKQSQKQSQKESQKESEKHEQQTASHSAAVSPVVEATPEIAQQPLRTQSEEREANGSSGIHGLDRTTDSHVVREPGSAIAITPVAIAISPEISLHSVPNKSKEHESRGLHGLDRTRKRAHDDIEGESEPEPVAKRTSDTPIEFSSELQRQIAITKESLTKAKRTLELAQRDVDKYVNKLVMLAQVSQFYPGD